MRNVVIGLVAGLTALGCGLGAPQPSMTIPLIDDEFGQFTLLVFDATGLVDSGKPADRRPGSVNSEAIANPEREELEVRWLGGACSHTPTLTLAGDPADLRLELQISPPEWQPPFLSCPAVGIYFGVTLSLIRPVAQEAVTLEVHE